VAACGTIRELSVARAVRAGEKESGVVVEAVIAEVRARALALLPDVVEAVARPNVGDVVSRWSPSKLKLRMAMTDAFDVGNVSLDDFYAVVDQECSAITRALDRLAMEPQSERLKIAADVYRWMAEFARRQSFPPCLDLVCVHDDLDAPGFLKCRVDHEEGRAWVWMRHCAYGQRVAGNFDPDELEQRLPEFEARGRDCSVVRRAIAEAKAENSSRPVA
jgi:hypothetical protein